MRPLLCLLQIKVNSNDKTKQAGYRPAHAGLTPDPTTTADSVFLAASTVENE